MKTKNFFYILSALVVIGIISSTGVVLAQESNNMQYPITELGKCKDKPACKTYCDKMKNNETCLNFALKNNLMSREQVETAQKFIAAIKNGPGECTTKDSCKEYCNNTDNIDECVAFAEQNGLISTQKLQKAKKVQAAISKGINIPNCKSKEECNTYCENENNMQECIAFGQIVGLLEGKDLENAQKIYTAIKDGFTPPPCKGKENCDVFCSQSDNMKICMNFAMQAGLMSDEEKTNAQRMLTAINGGVKLPNCKNKEKCTTYCQEADHIEECTIFAEKAGMITSEEAKTIKETGSKGPGGCANKEECATYCKTHTDECQKFQPAPGVINPGGQVMPQQAGPKTQTNGVQQNPATSPTAPENTQGEPSGFITPQSVLGAVIYGIQLFMPGK